MSFYCTSAFSATNGTDDQPATYVGYIATGLAVVFYGSNLVPVKKFQAYDGMVFQFFLCLGIWLVGMAVNAARGFPTFHALVMTGGAIWTFGNLFVVPIIQTIGLGLGILIWGIFNMLTGWATGRFGLLGIPAQVPDSIAFNYAGVGLSAAASVMFFFVKPQVEEPDTVLTVAGGAGDEGGGSGGSGSSSSWQQRQRPQQQQHLGRSQSDQDGSISVYEDVFGSTDGDPSGGGSSSGLYPSLNSQRRPVSNDKLPIVTTSEPPSGSQRLAEDDSLSMPGQHRRLFWMRLTPLRQRIFGISLAVMIGPMFGVGFVPTYYVQSHVAGASQNGLDYVFPHFTGIFVASAVFLLAYTVAMGNRPTVNPRIVLPATISGIMWGVAGASWFLANQVLSESISYPIISSAPAIVAALWSVCVFREIRGARNLILLCIAMTMSTAGSILNGLSKT